MSDIKEKETTNKEEIKENEIVGGGKQKEKKRLKGKTKKQLPRITDTEQYILQTVKGQNEQVRTVVTAAYRAIKLQNMKSIVLIIGKSGTGKTEILRQLSEKIGRVCVVEDANEFTQEGYYGRDVTEIISDLVSAANGNIKEAERGIVIIDEIDKKAGCATETRDVSGQGVLNSMLKLIEGKKVRIPAPDEIMDDMDLSPDEIEDLMADGIEFNTENVIFFLAGAFSGIEKIKEKRNGTKSLGFSSSTPDSKKNNKDSSKTTKEDLIAYGLTEEFVGRIDTIVEMNELSVDVLEEILRNSKKSKLNQYTRELKRYGILVEYDEKLPRAIAQKAKNGNTGARELSNVVNYMFDKILYDVMSKPKNTYKKCILLKGIEEENTRYKLE